MKTEFLKNVIPFAVVTLGISGAFVTTSMQKAPKDLIPEDGYALNPQGGCSDTKTSCDTQETDYVCRIGGLSGPQAFGKDEDDRCVVKLWRPDN